jgi:hypothetical protein
MSTVWSPRALAPLFLVALLACSDDDDTHTETSPDGSVPQLDATITDSGSTDGGITDGSVAKPPAADALYIVHSAVQNPDGARTNYFTLTKSLTTPANLDYGKAIAQQGRSRLYAQQDLGFFAIGAGETLSITRYTVGANDTMVPGASLSLQPQGVTSLGAQAVYFVSETKAYYKDSANAQIIVWNPKEMKFEKKIELPADLIKKGYSLGTSQWAAANGQVFFALGWSTTTFDKVLPGTKLVRIDSATDTVTISDDTRCRGLNQTANIGGALYFFSDVINAFGHAVYPNDGGQPACALRVKAGETSFDPTYVGDIAGAFRADQAATVVDVTSDGTAWVQVADLTVAPTTPGTTYNQWYDKGWSWFQVSLSTLQDPRPVATKAGAYSGITATVDSEFLITEAAADYSTSTLNALSTGTPKPGVTFGGFALDVARLR